ncbi:hypothetical protein BGAFAR04_E0012 (plasmid) [Borreliella garinii Far04]|nr:hypothetical protein BGAFAR04_E0012 [Borreliella garinii Far04]
MYSYNFNFLSQFTSKSSKELLYLSIIILFTRALFLRSRYYAFINLLIV